MGWFSFNRQDGSPTLYQQHESPVTLDLLEAGFITAFAVLAIAFYLVMPGYRGKEGLSSFLRITLGLYIGLLLMLGNIQQLWEYGSICSTMQYKAGLPNEIDACIEIKVGLHSVNVTLRRNGYPLEGDPLAYEIINYNERFSWTWDQGRFGFGPYAGRLQIEFRRAQLLGLPLPILWIVEYLIIDGEGIRFGRHYRTAGWYAHIAMWASLSCWVVANLLVVRLVRYAAGFSALAGAFQLLACVLWVVIRDQQLAIPISDGAQLVTHYGVTFWFTLFNGFFCIFLGAAFVFLDLRFPDELAVFFGRDPLTDYEEYHLTAHELEDLSKQVPPAHRDVFEMVPDMTEEESPENTEASRVVLKRLSTAKRAQRCLIRTPVPLQDDASPFQDWTHRATGSCASSPQLLHDA